MAPQNVRSLAAAQKLVQSLNSDTPMQECIDIAAVLTEDNWPMMEQAGYADFLISQAKKEFQDSDGSPVWQSMGLKLANALSGSVLALNKGGHSKYIPELRELALKILQPILSPDPTVGLPSLAPDIREQELENPCPRGAFHCIKVAGLLISAVHQSLQFEPDPAFKRIFNASPALEISLLVWYYAAEAYLRTIAAKILGQILHDTDDHASALSRCMRYLSAGEIAEKCTEMLRDESGPCPGEPTFDLRLVNIFCNPDDPGSRFDVAFSENGVQQVVMETAVKEMDQTLIIWGRIQHAGHILSKILAVDSTKTTMATEYVEKLGVLSVLARILADDSEYDVAKNGWMEIFRWISHAAGCLKQDCACWGRSASFVQVIKVALEPLWSRTLVELRALSNRGDVVLPQKTRRDRMMQWLAMGLAVGLKEDRELNGCRWQNCKGHGTIDETNDSKLLRCSRCRVARYCSKECQAKDWKDGHKVACNQIH